MEQLSCIFCKADSEHIVIEENGYTGKKCPSCGLIYISPRPSFSEIIDLYGHDNAQISAETQFAADFSKRLYARHHLRILRSYAKGGSLLEIGAGAGQFLDEARKTGFEPYGIEFNHIQAEHIRNHFSIPCEEKALDVQSFGGEKFDVVYHCDVASHFFDPIAEFDKINAVMKGGGILFFETGNLGEVKDKYYKYYSTFQYPDHLFFFGTENLRTLLAQTGFEIVKIHHYSVLPQFNMHRALAKTKNWVKGHTVQTPAQTDETTSTERQNAAPKRNIKHMLKAAIEKLYHYFFYVLRYKIGRIAPKKHRPQTLLIIARKR